MRNVETVPLPSAPSEETTAGDVRPASQEGVDGNTGRNSSSALSADDGYDDDCDDSDDEVELPPGRKSQSCACL